MSGADDYPDLYLRAVSGGAALPRSGGALSPDIVPWGTGDAPNPQALAQPPLWDEDPGRPLLADTPNTVYVRCANGSGVEVRGELHLAVGKPALPCWPDQLTEVPGPGGKHGVPIKVSGAGNAVTTTPFACSPASAADTLAAWAVTVQHAPTPTVPLRTVQKLQEFFTAYPAYVQRSVAFGISDSYSYQAHYAQRDAAARMRLELRCSNACPEWWVSVEATQTDFPLQIPSIPLNTPGGIYIVEGTVAAGCEDTLTFRIDTRGHPPAPDARIDLLLSLEPPPSAGPRVPQSSPFRLASHSWRASAPATDAASVVSPAAGVNHEW